jgi:predicted nucleotidyltransferase
MKVKNIELPREKIVEFCQRWEIQEFALFGSVLRDDFQADSDIDVLVAFAPDHRWTLFDHADMQEELAAIFGRQVDLVSKKAIECSRNYIRRENILGSAEIVYETQRS